MNPLTPYLLYIKIAAAAALLGLFWWGWTSHEAKVYQRGYDAAVFERKAADDQHLAEAVADAEKETITLRDQVATEALKRSEENHEHEKAVADLTGRIITGDIRLRAQAGICVRSDAKSGDPAAAVGSGQEEGAYVMPRVAVDVLRIAGDSAKDVRDRNALIDLYETMRASCNK
jgi:hypothetical protein